MAMFRKIRGWWCPKCECLMMAKKRKADGYRMISCDCHDVHLTMDQVFIRTHPGVYPLHEATIRRLKERQKTWKPLYILESPKKGEI